MSLTTIPLQQETRDKLRRLATKSESWDAFLNRLYDQEVTRIHAQVFFNSDTLSLDDALKEIDKW